jgi:hypothetical protein
MTALRWWGILRHEIISKHMKKLLTVLFILGCTMQLFAQGELSVSLGTAIPTGDFANKTTGGGAKAGLMGQLMYNYKIQKSNYGIAGMFRYQTNSVDASEFAKEFAGVSATAKNWNAFSFLVGPTAQFNLSDNVAIEPLIMVGYMSASSPKVSVFSGGSEIVTVGSASAGSLATLVGANVKFKIADNARLLVGVDYLTANPKFNITATSGGTSMSTDANQRIDAINLMVGVSFKLR